tara:strand:+ start:536 stop:856 length:321 start_codon:yes stop_codon:yes gene_type:complete
MDIEKLQHLKNEITKLDKNHHLQIFKLLKENNIKFSENRNGIFINMATINEEVIKLIEKELIYIKEQEKNLKDIELYKADLEQDFFFNHKAVKDKTTDENISNELS